MQKSLSFKLVYQYNMLSIKKNVVTIETKLNQLTEGLSGSYLAVQTILVQQQYLTLKKQNIRMHI